MRVSQRPISQLVSLLQGLTSRTFKSKAGLEIVLTKPVQHLGEAGQLVTVRHGYGRNFLFPSKSAVYATPINKEKHLRQGEGEVAKATSKAAVVSDDEEGRREAVIKRLSSKVIVLKREGFEDNNLIKEKVTAEDIAKAVLQQLRVDLHPGLVNLDDTEIGELGEGEVPLRILLKDRSHAHLRLSVVPTSV